MKEYIEVTLPSDNPWIRGPVVKVDSTVANRIAKVAASVAESLRGKFKEAHQYDAPVFAAVKDLMPENEYDCEVMYRAVGKILYKKANYKDWHDGNYAASRCFQTRNAYATPGFIEAKRHSEMHGT